jgi:hypothetical protein
VAHKQGRGTWRDAGPEWVAPAPERWSWLRWLEREAAEEASWRAADCADELAAYLEDRRVATERELGENRVSAAASRLPRLDL